MKGQKRYKFNSESEISEYLLENIGSNLKQAIKVTVEMMLKVEMQELRKELEEKLEEREKMYFNGYYNRHLVSPVGKVENIEIPRFRGGNEGYNIEGLKLFEEEKQRFFDLIAQMHLRGVSQKKIGEICTICFGKKMSKAQVGKVYKNLVNQEEYKINSQKHDDDFVFLVIDGIWEKVHSFRIDEENSNKMVVLCVLGVRRDGSRKILGYKLADTESYNSWFEILSSVKERGLLGNNLQIITSDGNEGGIKALKQIYPGKVIQYCLAHKCRSVSTKASRKNQKAIGEDFSYIMAAENLEEAKERAKEFEKKWIVQEQTSVNVMKHKFEEYFKYFMFPQSIWKTIRTTNILEREFREVRRRTKVFDNSFVSKQSSENYHNGLFTYLNQFYPYNNSYDSLFENFTH